MANKEVRQLMRRLRAKGLKIRKTKKNHLCVSTPKGPVICASTPSDVRGTKNFVAMLKRKGVEL